MNCSLFIVDLEDPNSPIYFKQDGGRFKMSTTLKLSHYVEYCAKLTIKSVPCPIDNMRLNGVAVDHQIQQQDLEYSELKFNLNSKLFQNSTNRRRTMMWIEVIFVDESILKLGLQVKFYDPKSSHLIWGNQFKFLHFEAQQTDEKDIYSITKIDYNGSGF